MNFNNNGLKAMWRPAMAFFLVVSWVVFLYLTYSNGGTMADVPTQFTAMTWSAFGWWYSSRQFEKTKG